MTVPTLIERIEHPMLGPAYIGLAVVGSSRDPLTSERYEFVILAPDTQSIERVWAQLSMGALNRDLTYPVALIPRDRLGLQDAEKTPDSECGSVGSTA